MKEIQESDHWYLQPDGAPPVFLFYPENHAVIEGRAGARPRIHLPHPVAIIAALVLGLCMVFAIPLWDRAQQSAHLEREGVVVGGQVLEKYQQGEGKYTTYHVRYQFTDASGRAHEAHGRLDPRRWSLIEVGDRVSARYLAEAPSQAVMIDGAGQASSALLVVLTVALLLLSAGSLIVSLYLLVVRLRLQRARRAGAWCLAEMEAFELRENQEKNWARYKFSFELRGPRGERQRRVARMRTAYGEGPSMDELPLTGDQVAVIGAGRFYSLL